MSFTVVKMADPKQDSVGDHALTKDEYLRSKADNFAMYVRTVATDTNMISQFEAMTTAQLLDYFITNVLPYRHTLSVPTGKVMYECGIPVLDTDAYNKVKRYLEMFCELIDA